MGAGQSNYKLNMSTTTYNIFFASFQTLASTTSENVPISVIVDRIKGALFGLLIADIAMPTHWFYGGERQVKSTYGNINGYVKPLQNYRDPLCQNQILVELVVVVIVDLS